MIVRSALALLLLCGTAAGQDVTYAHRQVDTLASPYFHGRGYVNDGAKKAAGYISDRFAESGLKKFGDAYFQDFSFPVNTFPGRLSLKVCGFDFDAVPGKNFLLGASSPSVKKGKHKAVWLDSAVVASEEKKKEFLRSDLAKKWVVIDKHGISDKELLQFMDAVKSNPVKAYGIVTLQDKKLTWTVSQKELGFPSLELLVTDSMHALIKKEKPLYLELEYEQKFFPAYTASNLIGYIEGSQHPDSFIVFSAHYDHLGRMGAATYFPGASDNASGTGLLLDLVRYYTQNKPRYSVVFMAFAGEEAGLVGSKYYTEHPLFPLNSIRFLINLDLVGAGEEGITVVNATEFKREFETLKQINDTKKYLTQVKSRGKAANSDHYHFSEKGVPAFFIYTMGSVKAYHDIYDTADKLPYAKYNELFGLITDFVEELQK